MARYYGRNSQLLQQLQAASRTAPAAAAFAMKFSEIEIKDDMAYAEDNTIDNSSAFMNKRDDVDETFSASLTSILCLNDIGHWLTLLLGAPVTTGTGPYTHTFTLDLAARPYALLELSYAARFRRFLDVFANKMSWSVIEGDQNMKLELIPSVEVSPRPSATFDAAPTALAKNRACAKGGNVYDVSGASTLGKITKADVEISNDLDPQRLADGLAGYGDVSLGQPSISGTLSALLDSNTSILDYQEGHTSAALSLVSTNSAGDASLTLNLPAVEFDKAKHVVNTSKGLVLDGVAWRAHQHATAATIVLVNGVASYGA